MFVSLEMDHKFWSVLIPEKIGWFKNIPRILRVYIPYHRDGFKSRQLFFGDFLLLPNDSGQNPCMTNGCWGETTLNSSWHVHTTEHSHFEIASIGFKSAGAARRLGREVVPLLSVCNAWRQVKRPISAVSAASAGFDPNKRLQMVGICWNEPSVGV